ncbi:MAG TPA: zinc-binding dehydrogenase [Acidimicrobiales bacterium]|nr:zinc-binding dehydrogenase [Acidimicrobiales bacterium]
MRALVLRGASELIVRDDVPDPEPGFGQVLAQVKACGICGSDLHFVQHAATMLGLLARMEGLPDFGAPPLDLGRDVFMGHEFAAEVLEVGPDTVAPPRGTIVTSIPIMLTPTGLRDIVYSNDLPAGYGERILLSAPLVRVVPNGLDPRHAALAEPMAVGRHAVNRSGIGAGEGAVVLGCGPVGLAVIAALGLRRAEPIVAADLSPARRSLATVMGAHEVVDPAVEPAFDAWKRAGSHGPPVVFEAIGVPGIIDGVLRSAPVQSRIVVVGVCMQPDTVTPFFGVSKELSVQFVLAYDPMEFDASLRSIAEGEIDVAPLITGEVGLDGVPGAFRELADPERHCKVLVVP